MSVTVADYTKKIAEVDETITGLLNKIDTLKKEISASEEGLKTLSAFPGFSDAVAAANATIQQKKNELQTLNEGIEELETVQKPRLLKERQDLIDLEAAAAKKKANENKRKDPLSGGGGGAGGGGGSGGSGNVPGETAAERAERLRKEKEEQATPLLPWWGWLLIVIAVILVIFAIVAAIKRKKSIDAAESANEQFDQFRG